MSERVSQISGRVTADSTGTGGGAGRSHDRRGGGGSGKRVMYEDGFRC